MGSVGFFLLVPLIFVLYVALPKKYFLWTMASAVYY